MTLHRFGSIGCWLTAGCLMALSTVSAAATPHNPQYLRSATFQEGSLNSVRQQQQQPTERKLDEALEVLYVNDNEEETTVSEGGGDGGKQDENDKESKSQDKSPPHEEKAETVVHQEKTEKQPELATKTLAAEDPLLAQEDTASTLLLDISLSLTAQRFLSMLAAILGMIWTAHQMSENPDGLYAGLCRSILTATRVLCRVVTCKSCFFGDGRGAAVHRHIPLDTWSVDIA